MPDASIAFLGGPVAPARVKDQSGAAPKKGGVDDAPTRRPRLAGVDNV